MNFIVLAVAVGAWAVAYCVYRHGEKRWAAYEALVIPGSPEVSVRDVMINKKTSPYIQEEPIYMGRLAQTKEAILAFERSTAKVKRAEY